MSADELNQQLNQKAPQGMQLEIPPKVFLEMGAEFLDYDEEGQRMRVRFPVVERYQNPMGNMQGGMVIAALDNVMGPLSYLVAPPSVTTQLNTSFIRPVTAQDEYIIVEAWVTERTKRQLFLAAKATNAEGKTLVIGQATCTIVAPE